MLISTATFSRYSCDIYSSLKKLTRQIYGEKRMNNSTPIGKHFANLQPNLNPGEMQIVSVTPSLPSHRGPAPGMTAFHKSSSISWSGFHALSESAVKPPSPKSIQLLEAAFGMCRPARFSLPEKVGRIHGLQRPCRRLLCKPAIPDFDVSFP